MGRLIGIDFGDRRIGLAWSDPTRTFSLPLDVVEGEAGLRAYLGKLLLEEAIDGFVVGLPLNMDGSVGPKAREILLFRDRLLAEWGKPVETWDERLTTVQAHGALRQSGLSARKRAGRVDKVAAQILLQSFLDRQKIGGMSP